MQMKNAAAVMTALLLPLVASAQTPAPSAPAKEAPKNYIPGIEQFMNVIQSEHAKLWYAGQARNWELAAYQLGEIKEIMSDVEDLYPTFQNLPLGQMLDSVVTGQIADVEKALDAKDFNRFSEGYGKLTEACNSCHQATGNGFVVIKRPAQPAFFNQDFTPRK
jgi:hypothetical protein